MTKEDIQSVRGYREAPGLNYSLAKHLLKSAAHYKAAKDEEQEPSEAMIIGMMAHEFVLCGTDLRDNYALKPSGMNFATKEGKAWRAEQTLPILKEDEANSVPFIADSIKNNPDANAILRGCQYRETPIFGNLMGVNCKCLIDLHGHAEDLKSWAITDFKTCVDASPREFGKVVQRQHYDLQLVWYSDLLAMAQGLDERPYWTWIAAEKKAPYFNVVYHPSEKLYESGRKKLEAVLTLYKECEKSGKWPFALTGIQELEPPTWNKEPHP